MPEKRDLAYEKELLKTVQKMEQVLDDLSDESRYDDRDFLAIERALQVSVEAFIGFCRYTLKIKYNQSVSKSREAVDELFKQGHFTEDQYRQFLGVIGFRNILVHNYLNVNYEVVKGIVHDRKYNIIQQSIQELRASF